MVVIGSRALKYWYPETREPKDYDVIGTTKELAQYVKDNYLRIKFCRLSRPGKTVIKLHKGAFIEFEVQEDSCGFGSCNEIAKASEGQPTVFYREINMNLVVCPPVLLLAIKKSHLSVPLKQWDKHMEDYHFLLQKVPVSLMTKDINALSTHRAGEVLFRLPTRLPTRLPKKPTNLNVPNDAFFEKSEGNLQRVYVHDDLHKATCYYDEPMFTKIKVDPSKAKCDESLFQKLVHTDKIRAVREEAFSIALERKIIPALELGQEVDAKEALKYALFRICTTLTSGWFASFAQDHYYEILDSDVDYVAKFKQAVSSGIITRKEP